MGGGFLAHKFCHMKNKAAEIVAQSVAGTKFATVIISGVAHTIYPPTIKVLSRAMEHFSHVDIPDESSALEAIFLVPENVEHMVKGISVIIADDVPEWREKAEIIGKQIYDSDLSELRQIFEEVIKLIHIDDFFYCAALAKSIARMAAEPK